MESNLRGRINKLSQEECKKVLAQTDSIYKQCQLLNSDDYCFDEGHRLKVDGEVKQALAVEIVVAIVNDYNCGKSIPIIMADHNLSTFQVISALCEYIFKQQGTLSRSVDFTNAIRYMYVEQSSIIELINLMILVPKLQLANIIGELLCLPSVCLLWVTLIWIELKNPKMANLFDCKWNDIVYQELSEQEFKMLDDEIEIVFESYRQSSTKFVPDIFSTDQLTDHLQMVREVMEERSKVINDTVKNINELDQIIKKQPSLEVETILSDSSDEEASPSGNDEICVLMQKVTSKWLKMDLTTEILAEEIKIESNDAYTMQLLSATNEVKNVNLQSIAMGKAPSVRCPEGTRVIAFYHPKRVKAANTPVSIADGFWLPGTVGAKPLLQNRFEYLIFFDNGIDGYISRENIRLMIEQPINNVTKCFEPRLAYLLLKNSAKQNFVRKYLHVFPDWPLIRLKKSENTMRVLARRDGKEESAFVLDVDRQMCLLRFPVVRVGPAGKTGRDCVNLNCTEHVHIDEWIYRGNSDRFPTLQSNVVPSGGVSSARRLGRNRSRFEIALPEYDCNLPQDCSNLNLDKSSLSTSKPKTMQTARKSNKRQIIELKNNPNIADSDSDSISRRKLSTKVKEDYWTAPDWCSLFKYQLHNKCSFKCISKLKIDLKIEDFIPCSPYFIPLINGWTRELRRIKTYGNRSEIMRIIVVYRAPCGIRLLRIQDVAKYLQITATENLTIDLFSFDFNVRPTLIVKPFKEEFVLQDDFANGLEDVKIPVINAFSNEKTPSMTYRARRFADSSIIDGSVQPQFCSGCSCLDNCSDSTKCECQQLTMISHDRLSASLRVHGSTTYEFRSLGDKVISGIYECNDMCPCSKKLCYNRVVQQNIKIPLELYMTAETGWGVRTLVDIPAGSFICTYSGRLLTDRMAELQGREVSDMYLAELDLHEVVEAEKQQQGIDLIDDDEGIAVGYDSDYNLSKEDDIQDKSSSPEFVVIDDQTATSDIDDNIEVCYVQNNLSMASTSKQVSSPPRSQNSTPFNFETYFGDNALFIVDAQESGNIGRFLNHSCEPNVFVQMVLVDTHDLRLPWVAFFAETFVKAGEELRWNYGYSPNSVPGKVLICKCGSQHCQGRLL